MLRAADGSRSGERPDISNYYHGDTKTWRTAKREMFEGRLVTAFKKVERPRQGLTIADVVLHTRNIQELGLETFLLESAAKDIQYVPTTKVVGAGDKDEANTLCAVHIRV